MSELEIVLAAFASGSIGAAIMKGVEIWKRVRKELNEPIIQKTVENSKQVYRLLNQLKADSDGVRACLLRAHNGGSVPKTGTPTYTTMAYETYDNDQSPIQQNWNARPVDEQYMNMLSELLTKGQIVLDVDSMQENSLLRGTYKLSHVRYAIVTLVKTTKTSVFYLSLHFNDELEADTMYDALIICRNYADQLYHLIED